MFIVNTVTITGSFDDYYAGLPFFGLAATVCAWLWLKSNYIPKGLSIFGVIAVNDYIFDSPMALFELVVSFWLLFKGLPRQNADTAPP